MAGDKFYSSPEWLKVRHKAIARAGFKCQMCGCDVRGRGKAHVDHIKPRRKYPELSFDINNLQVLCASPCHNSVKKRMENGKDIKEIASNGLPADGSWD